MSELRKRISRLSVPPTRNSSEPSPIQPTLGNSSTQPSPSRRSSTQRSSVSIEDYIRSIDRKLDSILIKQDKLEEQVKKLKESFETRDFSVKDKSFVKVIKVFTKVLLLFYIYICMC